MTLPSDTGQLAALLERQFELVAGQSGTRRLLRLQRLIRFIHDEPAIVGLLADLENEASEELSTYANKDRSIRARLRDLWNKYGTQIQAQLSYTDDDSLNAYGCKPDSYLDSLDRMEVLGWHELVDHWLPQGTQSRINSLRHWCKCAQDLAGDESTGALSLEPLRCALVDLEREQGHAAKHLLDVREGHGWPAYGRLVAASEAMNPRLPEVEDDFGGVKHALATALRDELLVYEEHGGRNASEAGAIELHEQLEDDLVTVREEFMLRVGRQRSRLAIVKRYAVGCEAFRAKELREMVVDSKRPEDRLTLDFARYLFETGLNPLIDANVSNLKPDILHLDPGALFYVEAKQYKGEHPRSNLIDAYKQVWSTWSRLRKRYPSREAFLVVFRRGGPFVELPEVITHNNLKLYSILADISTEAGSKEKLKTFTITAEEVKPQEEGG